MSTQEQRVATRLASGGPVGNERLTAATAAVLLVLLAVEGVTIVFLAPLISVHLFVGLVLIPPIAVKLASTGYRFARYYTGSKPYVEKGPPHAVLRLMAPFVVATTLVVFATGVWLLVAGPRVRDTMLPLHKLSFIAWFAFTTVHVLGHITTVPRALGAEYGHRDGADGRVARQVLLLAALLAGVVLALLLLPDFGHWQHASVHD